MKPIRVIILLLIGILAGACSLRSVMPPPVQVDPSQELFERAEALFDAKSYDQCLDLYKTYLDRYPQGPLKDAAIMKIGAVYSALGNYTQARLFYNRLIDEEPESVFAGDARSKVLGTLYYEGRYEELIRQAKELMYATRPDGTPLKVDFLSVYTFLGHAHLALGSPAKAIEYYVAADAHATDQEKEVLLPKLKEAISQLTSEEIEDLISRTEDPLVSGYLMYQLGLNRKLSEKYDDALRVLSDFIADFPDHEYVQQAETLMEEIRQKTVYQRTAIGCLLPLSGSYQAYGNRALKGIELALHQFGGQQALSGLKLIVKDTGSDPDRAAMAVEELSGAQVALVIGPIITAEPAARQAQKQGIPIITLTQKDNIPEIGDYVFRNFITPRMQVEALVSYAVKTLGLYRYAIVYPQENYGITYMNLFWDELTTYGARVVGVESYSPNQTDFADPIKKLVGLFYEIPQALREPEIRSPVEETSESSAADEPQAIVDFDAVFIPDAPKKAGLLIPQLAFYDVGGVQLLGTNLWHSERLIQMSKQFVQNAIMTDGFFADSESAPVREFVTSYQKIFNENPAFIEAVAYDTAMLAFELVSRPDLRFRSAIRDALMQLDNFQGVTGPTSFDEMGEARKTLFLLQIRGDKFIELQ